MSYEADAGRVSAVHRPTTEVAPLDIGSAASVRFVAPGSLCAGRFGLFRWDMAPRAGGPRPHFHKTFSESFYVLAGTVRLYDGATWVDATAGDFLSIPEGGVHAFANDSEDEASMLILFAPGAPRERYFEELAEIGRTGRRLGEEEWAELYARHDQFMV
ncbi:MAG: cupin domain-containing protein [Actinomycetota bacterium]|nr:cupin domain-containing protein [Actinomycetota bacterium]